MKAVLMKKIKGFDRYFISKEGEILDIEYNNSKKCKILKQSTNLDGYKFIQLSKNGKVYNKRINRLVAETYIPNPQQLPQVNHKDENKANNRVENLEWCNAQYNCTYKDRHFRAAKKRRKKVLGFSKEGELLYELDYIGECKKYGFNQGHISAVCLGKRKTHGGIVWKFTDISQNTINKENNTIEEND